MYIRRARPEDLCRMAEIFVYANRLNSFPIFGDEAYSFSQLQVSAVLADFSGWIGEMGNAYVWDDGIVRGFVVSAGGEVYKLYVDSFFSGRGIGGALLEFAAAQTGASRLWVLEKNREGPGLLRKARISAHGEWNLRRGHAGEAAFAEAWGGGPWPITQGSISRRWRG